MSRCTNRRIAVAGITALTVGVLAACGGSAATDTTGRASRATAGTQVAPAVAAAATTCSPPATASYPPLANTSPSSWPSGSLMQTIKDRGYLVVGVSGDTRLLGARDALAGGKLDGFDIGMARQVAIALFGRADDSTLHLKVITTGQRFTSVNTGAGTRTVPLTGVDMVARAVTMNCDRWTDTDPAKHAAFSSVYLLAHQRLLVRQDSGVTSVAQLQKSKAKVCAPTGSTSLTNIAKFTGIQTVAVEIHSDCLALWQEGKVDAITGDDAILAGFKAQDPHALIVGQPLEDEPYGLAVAAAHPEFARFLNAVLEQIRANGTWQGLYDQWLRSALGPASPPRPDYGRAA
jgi:polar amino acid transport system substrate-binding protein